MVHNIFNPSDNLGDRSLTTEVSGGLSYNFDDCLVTAATRCPDKFAFIFQKDSAKKAFYLEQHLHAKIVVGDRLLLVYPPVLRLYYCIYGMSVCRFNCRPTLPTIHSDCDRNLGN